MGKFFLILLLVITGACAPVVSIAPVVPCASQASCTDNPAARVNGIGTAGRGPLDTRTFVQIAHTGEAATLEILANGRPFANLKQGEVIRVPLWPAMFRGQRVETVLFARGYNEQGQLIGTLTKRVSVRGGDRQGREIMWEVRNLRRVR